MRWTILSSCLALMLGCSDTEVLRASHQWPEGDVRGEMLDIIKEEIEAAGVGLQMRIYPGQSLFQATEQWPAMIRGRLDMSVFPLAYASGRHAEFNITLMPGLVKSHAHAERVNQSAYMNAIRKRVEDEGVIVLADAWLAGGFASKERCILVPDDVKGQTIRGAGKAFEQMLLGAGGSITSMASSEIYTAMQTGVLDATITSSLSFTSFRLYEQVECLTAPGDTALWFMYEPILMSKARFGRLSDEQQAALVAASKKAEAFFAKRTKEVDLETEDVFRRAGVEVVHMTAEQLALWLELAETTSYVDFAKEVEGGRELLDQALGVE